jgi:hypothetical protein
MGEHAKAVCSEVNSLPRLVRYPRCSHPTQCVTVGRPCGSENNRQIWGSLTMLERDGMSPIRNCCFPLVLLLPAIASIHLLWAQMIQLKPEVKMVDGIAYLSTGIGHDSRIDYPHFSLKMVFSTRGKSYLADIDVEISPDSSGKPIKIHSVGPWLLVDLPPGNYKVTAKTTTGRKVSKSFVIVKSRMTSVQMVWDISDEDI